MNTIKVRKDTQLEHKHWLLTDTPGGWKRASWKRVVRNTKCTYRGSEFSIYVGEVKINGHTWIASARSDGETENSGLVFHLEYPKFEYERKRRIFGD